MRQNIFVADFYLELYKRKYLKKRKENFTMKNIKLKLMFSVPFNNNDNNNHNNII